MNRLIVAGSLGISLHRFATYRIYSNALTTLDCTSGQQEAPAEADPTILVTERLMSFLPRGRPQFTPNRKGIPRILSASVIPKQARTNPFTGTWSREQRPTEAAAQVAFVPRVVTIDRLPSYVSAFRALRLTCRHEQELRMSNRAENFHQVVRRRDRKMQTVQVGRLSATIS